MLIATDAKVYVLTDSDGSASPALRFEGDIIRCLSEARKISVIGLAGGEIALLTDGGTRHISTGIEEPLESLAVLDEEPLHLLIGTEGPHIYWLFGDGQPAQRMAAFDELECRNDWYTPWGGPPAVRSLAHSGDWVYADIHVGSIMRSLDRGASWEPVTPELNEDVHQVTTSPRQEERVYANTANAVYVSEDRGQSWQHRASGLSARYGRAIAVHPEDPDCLIASVSKGPSRNVEGKLYRSDDTGRTWTHVTRGFPGFYPEQHQHLPHCVLIRWHGLGRGRRNPLQERGPAETWTLFWEAPEPIAAISCST